jgi:uncharacterized membrane protein YqiK
MQRNAIVSFILAYWWVFAAVLFLLAYKLVFRLFGIVIVPDDSIGIVNKKWVIFGANRSLPDGAIVALRGEAGIQADTLAPGLHFWLWPWQFEIQLQKFVTVPTGGVGVVSSRDGARLPAGRVLAKRVECSGFQDARSFLAQGGQRGPQMAVIPPGTYRINTALFTVELQKALEIADNMVGIVTTKDGVPLALGEIAGREVRGHAQFQDPQEFIDAGGSKGLQEQVILAGRYYINPQFATVETVEMTRVPIGYAGVVIAYVGDEGADVTGEGFKHGNLVRKGQKGVWVEPLDPGKYPLNTITHKIELVPTTNVVLNWATGKTESHKLDEKLSTIKVRSSDGFTFNLDVSQIIHVPRTSAPKVIARFGNMDNLVTQVLEPTIGNYFRNSAQESDVISFLKERSQRQESAKGYIHEALDEYDVQAVDTLIGDIAPPEQLMKTLTDRKLAEQERTTYDIQRQAEEVRRELQQARAAADTQPEIVAAERRVQVSELDAQSLVKKASGEAESKTINARADAEVLTVVGKAEGEKISAVGSAEAEVIRRKTEAVGQSNYAVIEVGRALAANKIPLVPQIQAGGNGDDGGSLVSVLLAGLIRDGLKGPAPGSVKRPSAD